MTDAKASVISSSASTKPTAPGPPGSPGHWRRKATRSASRTGTSRATSSSRWTGRTQQSRRTIAVLSPDYLTSRFTAPEWAARFAQDATSEHDLLIPVRVRPCELEGLLAQIVYVDLVGCGEAPAREKLLRRVEGIRLKPDEPPLFPGEISHEAVPERPAFPAAVSTGRDGGAEQRASTANRQASPPPWLIGAMALVALGVVTIIWGLASGPSATVGGPASPIPAPRPFRVTSILVGHHPDPRRSDMGRRAARLTSVLGLAGLL